MPASASCGESGYRRFPGIDRAARAVDCPKLLRTPCPCRPRESLRRSRGDTLRDPPLGTSSPLAPVTKMDVVPAVKSPPSCDAFCRRGDKYAFYEDVTNEIGKNRQALSVQSDVVSPSRSQPSNRNLSHSIVFEEKHHCGLRVILFKLGTNDNRMRMKRLGPAGFSFKRGVHARTGFYRLPGDRTRSVQRHPPYLCRGSHHADAMRHARPASDRALDQRKPTNLDGKTLVLQPCEPAFEGYLIR